MRKSNYLYKSVVTLKIKVSSNDRKKKSKMDKIVTIMKGKMLILLAVICSFTACVKEELIGPSEGEDITITAALSTETIQSKATATVPGNDDEKTMTKGVILVFWQAGGDEAACIGVAETTASADGKTMLANVKTKIGAVRFVAVANAEDDLQAKLKNVKKYSDLKILITQQQLANPKNLIKVGESMKTLTHETTKVNFTVYQLPAFVKLTLSLKKPESGWIYSILKNGSDVVSVSEISKQSPLILGEYDESGVSAYTYSTNTVYGTADFTVNDNGDELGFYTYEKNTNGAPIVLKIPVLLKKSGGSTKTVMYTLNLNPVKGGDSKTDGIIHGYYYDVQAKIDPKDPEIDLVVTVKSFQVCEVEVNYGN